MSDRAQRDRGETEEIDALPVPVDVEPDLDRERSLMPEVSRPRPIVESRRPARPLADIRAAPALQAAAVAAGGFVAGAAVVGLARRRHSAPMRSTERARRSIRRGSKRGGRRQRELAQVVASRSFLVDVHLLGPADRGR